MLNHVTYDKYLSKSNVFILLSRNFVNFLLQFLMQGRAGLHAPVFERFQQKAEYFMCSCLGKGSRNVQKTPGGLIFRQRWNNMQFVTSASFLATVYSDYLASAGTYLKCSAGNVPPAQLLGFAKSQVIYWLPTCFDITSMNSKQ